MKNKGIICHYAKGADGCKECGSSSNLYKPCHMKIPNYIPDTQIHRFVECKEKLNV